MSAAAGALASNAAAAGTASAGRCRPQPRSSRWSTLPPRRPLPQAAALLIDGSCQPDQPTSGSQRHAPASLFTYAGKSAHLPLAQADASLVAGRRQLVQLRADQAVHHVRVLAKRLGAAGEAKKAMVSARGLSGRSARQPFLLISGAGCHCTARAGVPPSFCCPRLVSGTTVVNRPCCCSPVGLRSAGGRGLTRDAGAMAGRSATSGTLCGDGEEADGSPVGRGSPSVGLRSAGGGASRQPAALN